MGRTLRLFACAAAMLVAAVGVAAFLKDEPGYEAGRSEISGKIVGLTEFQSGRGEPSASAEDGRARSLQSSSSVSADDGRAPEASSPKKEMTGSTSAPFDTRPASVETERSSETAMVAKAERSEGAAEKASASVSAPAAKERLDAAPAEEKKGAPAKAEKQEAPESRPSEAVPGQAEGSSEGRAAEKAAKESGQDGAAAAEQSGQTYERVVTSAKFSMQGSQIKLTLQGNAPMVGHYFTLGDPDRVVLDLAGNWEVDVPRVPSNRLIQAVRVGQHDDKTRIVFDMKTTGRAALVPLNRNALELRIQ